MTKFKTIPDDYYITILDRLTRFEPACVRYERVFNDLISKFCLDKIQKNISILDKITLTEELLDFNLGSNSDNSISSILTDLEGKYFEFNCFKKLQRQSFIRRNWITNGRIKINIAMWNLWTLGELR